MPWQESDVAAAGTSAGRSRSEWLSIALIVGATVAAYSNSLQGPFIFDDLGSIVENRSIRHLWPPRDFLVNGRPVVVFSWALNHALGGLDPRTYHLTNLAIHLLAALALFGIVHRTLALPGIPERLGRKAIPLGLAAALIWALHPLQTQSVTYLTQRYESMMGLFYLSALYCLIRAGTSERSRAWAVACVAATLLAMASKEVAVSVPVILLLYDRAFLAGSLREAWRRRWGLYLGLLGAWLGFALLQFQAVNRSGWAGYDLPHSWQEYALSQFGVILHYLRLSLWPQPLVLDYGWPVARGAREILPGALVVGGLAAVSAYALVRRPKLGLLGAWFFLILAPTSSILPLADIAFIHRLYLPLAAIVLLVVLGGETAIAVMNERRWLGARMGAAVGTSMVAAAVVALAAATWHRNRDYESALSIWRDTVAKAPGNPRAQSNLAAAYGELGRPELAIVHLQEAIRLKPGNADTLSNLGATYYELGNPGKAVGYLEEAIRLKPDFPRALNNLGLAYGELGDPGKAIGYLQRAIRLKPDYADAFSNLGATYYEFGNAGQAVVYLQRAVRLEPKSPGALINLGLALVKLGRYGEATAVWQTLKDVDPALAEKLRAQIPASGG